MYTTDIATRSPLLYTAVQVVINHYNISIYIYGTQWSRPLVVFLNCIAVYITVAGNVFSEKRVNIALKMCILYTPRTRGHGLKRFYTAAAVSVGVPTSCNNIKTDKCTSHITIVYRKTCMVIDYYYLLHSSAYGVTPFKEKQNIFTKTSY